MDSKQKASLSRRHSAVVAACVAASFLGPILMCYLAVEVLHGARNLKNQYWFSHGVFLSAVANAIALARIRRRGASFRAERDLPFVSLKVVGYSGVFYFVFLLLASQ